MIISSIVGNVIDAAWKEKLKTASVDYLALNQWDAQKNRFRKKTENGVELAVSLDRNSFLHNGDILSWDEATRNAVVAKIDLREVLVIELKDLSEIGPQALVHTCVELGHALGNQHWPAVVKGNKVYVPLTVDKKVMASVMNTHAFKNATYTFAPGTEVIPYLFPHESRRLFGGAEQESRAHPDIHAAGDEHCHNHGRAHSH